jgi:hypothetical protein
MIGPEKVRKLEVDFFQYVGNRAVFGNGVDSLFCLAQFAVNAVVIAGFKWNAIDS